MYYEVKHSHRVTHSWFIWYSDVTESFATSCRISRTCKLQQALALHGLNISSSGIPRSHFNFIIHFQLHFFIIIFGWGKQKLLTVTSVLNTNTLNVRLYLSICRNLTLRRCSAATILKYAQHCSGDTIALISSSVGNRNSGLMTHQLESKPVLLKSAHNFSLFLMLLSE